MPTDETAAMSFREGRASEHLQSLATEGSDFKTPQRPADVRWQVTLRVAERALDKFSDVQSFYGFLGCAVGIFGLGFCEGMLLCRKRDFRFAARYGLENILPSITHATKNVQHIALAAGRKPDELLISNPTTAKEASMLLRSEGFRTARNILFGMVGVATAVKIVDLEEEAEREFEQQVYNGREPLLSGTEERVVRLMGQDSACTDLSVKLHGHHIVPIMEHGACLHLFALSVCVCSAQCVLLSAVFTCIIVHSRNNH